LLLPPQNATLHYSLNKGGKKGVDIEPGGTGEIVLHYGAPNVININKPARWVIETKAGTVIKCLSTPNDPLEITPSSDLKNVTLIIGDDSTTPIQILKP
jgi:hypothetical protein